MHKDVHVDVDVHVFWDSGRCLLYLSDSTYTSIVQRSTIYLQVGLERRV